MSAADCRAGLSYTPITLIVPASEELRRYLEISWKPSGVSARFILPEARMRTAVFVETSSKDRVHVLVYVDGSGALFVNGTVFDLARQDVELMRAVLEPFGLGFDSPSNSTAPIGPSAVKESASATDPLSGVRGVLRALKLSAQASGLSHDTAP